MKNRLFVAVALFVVGTSIYLWLSGSSVQLQAVTISTQLAFLLSLSYFAWVASLKLPWRVMALVGTVVIASVVSVIVDSFFIKALTPLHVLYFLTAILAFMVEGLAFLAITWLVDQAAQRIRLRRQLVQNFRSGRTR